MSISITWANYALIVSVCLFLYYVVVWILSYKFQTSVIFKKKSELGEVVAPIQGGNATDKNLNLFGEDIQDEVFSTDNTSSQKGQVQNFVDEISALIISSEEDVSKEALATGIKRIIYKYPSSILSESKYELSQLIALSSENYCSIHFSSEELKELWV